MEQSSIEAVPRHQGSAGQRAAAGTVSTQQVAQSSDVEGSQLHCTTGEERQLRMEEEKNFVLQMVGSTSSLCALILWNIYFRDETTMTAATVTVF